MVVLGLGLGDSITQHGLSIVGFAVLDFNALRGVLAALLQLTLHLGKRAPTNVLMTRATDRLVSDHVIAHFTADRKSLVGVEGDGHVTITTVDEGDTGKKEITCDRFWSEVAGGQISAINAAGEQVPAHAIVEGPPKRDMVARTIRVGLTNKDVYMPLEPPSKGGPLIAMWLPDPPKTK